MAGGGTAVALWTAGPVPSTLVRSGAGGIDAAVGDAAPLDDAGTPDDAAGEDAGAVGARPVDDAGIAEAVDERAPGASDAGVKRPGRRRVAPKPPDEVAAPGEPGQYSVDSRPYATIFIDGKSYGETPLFKVALPPGKHRIRAVREDGEVRRYTVTIEAGKLTSSGTLAW